MSGTLTRGSPHTRCKSATAKRSRLSVAYQTDSSGKRRGTPSSVMNGWMEQPVDGPREELEIAIAARCRCARGFGRRSTSFLSRRSSSWDTGSNRALSSTARADPRHRNRSASTRTARRSCAAASRAPSCCSSSRARCGRAPGSPAHARTGRSHGRDRGARPGSGSRIADIHAIGPVRCIVVTRDLLVSALVADPRAAVGLIDVLALRFRETA